MLAQIGHLAATIAPEFTGMEKPSCLVCFPKRASSCCCDAGCCTSFASCKLSVAVAACMRKSFVQRAQAAMLRTPLYSPLGAAKVSVEHRTCVSCALNRRDHGDHFLQQSMFDLRTCL